MKYMKFSEMKRIIMNKNNCFVLVFSANIFNTGDKEYKTRYRVTNGHEWHKPNDCFRKSMSLVSR